MCSHFLLVRMSWICIPECEKGSKNLLGCFFYCIDKVFMAMDGHGTKEKGMFSFTPCQVIIPESTG